MPKNLVPATNAGSGQSEGGGREGTATRQYRVLMIAPTSFFADYGCHVRILEEAVTLRGLGQQVTIATYYNGNEVADLDIQRSLPVPWRRKYEVGSSRHKIALDALLGLKTLRLLATRRFDVIHAHLHEGALIGLTLGRMFGVPVVFDFQGSMTAEMKDHGFLRESSPLFGPLRKLETWLDRAAPVVLTSTRQSARLLVEDFGCRSDRIQCLPDCVNTNTFVPASSYAPEHLSALRSGLGIPEDRKLIVYLGLLATYQGTDLLLEALRELLQRRTDVHLLMMGFPRVQHYTVRARELGIEDHVTFTGRMPYPQSPEYLALGDVAAAPKLSLTEGAGKILNYMACALPVVAFDTPIAQEYLDGDGRLVAPHTAGALAQGLEESLWPAQAEVERARAERLRQRAISNYRWDHAGDQIIEAYRLVCGDRSRPAPRPRPSPACD